MKIIITESQLKNIIKKMYDDGFNIHEIQNYTGKELNEITNTLKNHIKVDPKNIGQLYDLLWDIILPSGLMEKQKTFDDQTKIELDVDYLSGAIVFDYFSKKEKNIVLFNHNIRTKRIYGWATILWDGEKHLPIDIDEIVNADLATGHIVHGNFTKNSNKIFDEKDFIKIKTLGDYIDFLNKHYINYIKIAIDNFIKK